jgi:hypothetical protein
MAAASALARAKDVQRAVVDRARSESGAEEGRQRTRLAELYRCAAKLYEVPPMDTDRAAAEYK